MQWIVCCIREFCREPVRVTITVSCLSFIISFLFSSWRFVHKDKTVFGDELWLSVFGLNNNKDGTNSEQFDIVESPKLSLISITTAETSADEDIINSSKCKCQHYI